MQRTGIRTRAQGVEVKRRAARAGDGERGDAVLAGVGIQTLIPIGGIGAHKATRRCSEGNVIAVHLADNRIVGVVQIAVATGEGHFRQQILISVNV